jgi:hypothetical protein
MLYKLLNAYAYLGKQQIDIKLELLHKTIELLNLEVFNKVYNF